MHVPSRRQANWRCRHLEFERNSAGMVISFDRCVAENAVLRFREREVRRAVRAVAKRFGEVSQGLYERRIYVFGAIDDHAASDLLRKLDTKLVSIASRPFPPKIVERVLGISTRERLRWSKDGRLPRSGSATFSKGGLITVATHPADKTLELAASPGIIMAWRRADLPELEG
jgi:hypothetical protein